MQPSSPDAQNQMPQTNPTPMQANPAPVNYEVSAAAPYTQTTYAYPPNAQAQFTQAPQAVAGAPQTTGGHGGEKVIQPIHDINEEQQQSEIQRQMAELLGEAVEPNSPQMAGQGYAASAAQATAQMQPAQAVSYTPLPHIEAPTAYNQARPNTYPQQAYYQQPNPQAAAAMQMQALQAEEMRRAQYAQAAAAQQMAAQQAQAQAQAQAQYQQQMSGYSQISQADAQKVASSIVTPPIPMPPTPTTMPPSATPPAQSAGQEMTPPLDAQNNNG